MRYRPAGGSSSKLLALAVCMTAGLQPACTENGSAVYSISTVVPEGGPSLVLSDEQLFYISNTSRIAVVSLSGGPPKTLYIKKDPLELLVQLAVDQDRVYWCDVGLNRISWISRAGGPAVELVQTPTPQAIAISSGKLYWASANGQVGRVNLNGTDRELITTDGQLTSIGLDGQTLFVSDLLSRPDGTSRLISVDFAQRFIHILSEPRPVIGQAVLARGQVYYGTGNDTGGQLRAALPDGTKQQTLASTRLGVLAIHYDGLERLYFATFGRSEETSDAAELYVYDITKKRVQHITGGLKYPQQIVTSGQDIFWIEDTRIGRATKQSPLSSLGLGGS